MTDDEFKAWLPGAELEARTINIFGSFKTWKASLPEREWVHGEGGWHSKPR